MFRHLAALILAAVVLAASTSSGVVDGRPVHTGPYHVVIRTAAKPSRRLIGLGGNAAICQEVHYKALCGTLTTLPGVMTPQQLLDAALRVAESKAMMAEKRLADVMKSRAVKAEGTSMSSTLDTCKGAYSSLADALQKARDTIKSGGSHDDLMTELSSASTFSTDCGEAFDEFPDLTSPIPGAQRHVNRLVSNCLDLAATIKEN
ncbi:hypothetical protein EE612_005228 [Oryza sativa]|uniref:Pectinesterase inhibitor domain-containing protein n=3 Tax=Oryza TaxID=4527 RepID=A0A0E0N1C3_ORYRU|nr:hypothetical protein OsI_03426 [Oryza sativa Indica Group]KAB8083125.1 hypothetical protein EE612_005228 [Oryza sativa]